MTLLMSGFPHLIILQSMDWPVSQAGIEDTNLYSSLKKKNKIPKLIQLNVKFDQSNSPSGAISQRKVGK